MTSQLLQQIFAELDPHKKAFITLKDWKSCFLVFSKGDTLMIEFKNFMQSKFQSSNSAFNFFLQFDKSPCVSYETFNKGVLCIFGSSRVMDVKHLFRVITKDKSSFNKEDFATEFANISFKGSSEISKKEVEGSTKSRARS